jgi:hypothetical protein
MAVFTGTSVIDLIPYGYTSVEQERLIRQARVLAPLTELASGTR